MKNKKGAKIKKKTQKTQLENVWKALEATVDRRVVTAPSTISGIKPLSVYAAAKKFDVSLTSLLRYKQQLTELPESQRPTSLAAFLS